MSTVESFASSVAGTPQLPTGISRTVIIGVGGTGKEIITRVRKHIIQGFGSLSRVPVISFVQIDTDKAQPRFHLEKDYADAGQLKGAEMVWASLSAGDLGDDLAKHRHLATWVSPKMEKYEITEGAKQIRQLGRLAFFTKYPEIWKAVQGAYEKAINPDHAERMLESGLLVEGEGLNIYIVGSLCGGTGGGMILDLAYMCRRIIKNVKGAKIFGYLVLPEVFSTTGDTQVKANSFAALKEIDYFSSGNSLDVQYSPQMATAFRLQNRPFTTTYLLNGTNEQGVKLNVPQLYDMGALHIFTDFVPGGIGSLNRSNRDNLSARCDFNDQLGCNQSYMTLGLSRIYFPYDRFIRACGLRLSLSLTDHWLKAFSVGREFARMKECVEDFCRQNPQWLAGDLRGGLIGRLATLPDGTPMRESVHGWLDGLIEEVKIQKIKGVKEFFSREFGQFEEEKFFDDDPFEQNWRGYAKAIAKNVETRYFEYQAAIDAEISKRVELDLAQSEAGLSYSIQFLEVLEDRLKQYESRFHQDLERETDEIEAYFQKVSKAIGHVHEVANDFFVKIGGGFDMAMSTALEQLQEASLLYFEAMLAVKAYKKAPALLDRMRKHLREWRAQLHQTQGLLTNVQNDLLEMDEAVKTGIEPGELYEETDIQEFYDEYLPDGEIRRNRLEELNRRVLVHFNCDGFHQLPMRAREDLDFKGRMCEALLGIASEYFQDLAKVSMAERFFKKYPNEQMQRTVLLDAYRRSAPYLQLEAVPGYLHNQPENLSVAIGIAGGNQQPPDQDFAKLLKLIKATAPNISDKFIMDLADREKHQIIFIRERAAFPLRAIAQLREYSLVYEDFRSAKAVAGRLVSDQNPPLHIIKDDMVFDIFPGVLPPDEEKSNAAYRAFVIGIAWGIFDLEGETVIYRMPRPGVGIEERKVIGSLRDPFKAIQRLITLGGEGQGKVLDHVLDKIQQKVEQARLSPALLKDLHQRLQQEFIQREHDAQEAYLRTHPEVEDTDEGWKTTREYTFCRTIEAFIQQTGLLAPEPPATGNAEAQDRGSRTVPAASEPVPVSPLRVHAGEAACASCEKPIPSQARFCPFCEAAQPLRTPLSTRLPASSHCASCQASLLGGARICHMCGTKVPPAGVQCGSCQQVLPADARFCAHCTQAIVLE